MKIVYSDETFISFSKYINNTFSVRFIDTFKFLPTKLETLAKNLLTDDFGLFRATKEVFEDHEMGLVTRKGVYPYEYTDSWSRLDETELPEKAEFYSMLKEEHISDIESSTPRGYGNTLTVLHWVIIVIST